MRLRGRWERGLSAGGAQVAGDQNHPHPSPPLEGEGEERADYPDENLPRLK